MSFWPVRPSSRVCHMRGHTSSSASEASSSSSSSSSSLLSPCFIFSSEYCGGTGGPIRSESESESPLLSVCGFLRERKMWAKNKTYLWLQKLKLECYIYFNRQTFTDLKDSFWGGAEECTDVELSPSSSCSRALCRSSREATYLVQSGSQRNTTADYRTESQPTKHMLTPLNGCPTGLFKNGLQIKCASLFTWKEQRRLVQSLTQAAEFIIKQRKPRCYIPNPENPITDAMSPSPLILSDMRKEGSVIYFKVTI